MPLLPNFTNFTDMEVKPNPSIQYPGFHPKGSVTCPQCKGYGGSVLQVDAYGKGKHFRCHCMQCNGWGWVEDGSKDATCVHEFTEENVGNCLHKWTCKKCGASMVVDSSD